MQISSDSSYHQPGWAVRLLGIFLILLGLPQTIGGVWLIAVGGSWYYLPAGLALCASGALLLRGHSAAAWIYLAFFAATVLWSVWEAGLDGWGLLPRLFGLTLVLALVVLCLPRLRPVAPRGATTVGVAMLVAVILGLGVGIARVTRAHAFAAVPKTSASTAPATSAAADWPVYGGTASAQRYSSLDRITRANVSQLKQAWLYHTRDLPDERWGAETTPLKIGDALFLCSARNVIISIDARTGKERWRFDPRVADTSIPYTAACRGVSYYSRPAADSDQCANRIIEGTLDARLIAVDAATGKPCADFGRNGQVDTTLSMGEHAPGMVSITSPPTIVRGVVITGHQILDGQKRDAPSGVIQGYDAISGELRWAWDLARPDRNGAPPVGETYTRGTPNSWTTSSADEKLGLVYLPLGNSAADYFSGSRSEPENRFTASLVALDATTGRLAWSFQTVRKDVWDYDLGAQGTLVDFPTATAVVPAILVPSKQGDIYVLDRRTGTPLTKVEERTVPRGGVEPEQRSPTQIYSLYHTLRFPDLTERDMWGMSPIDQMACRIEFRRAHYQGFYTPPTADRHSIEYPGYNGGTDWGGIALDPRRGVIVANYNDMPNYNRLVPRKEADRRGWFPRGDPRADRTPREGGPEGAGDPQIGVPYAIDVNAGWRMPFTRLLCKKPPYGGIRAIDLASGRTLWDRPLGSARNNGPFGIPSHLPLEIGTPNNGGAVVTAGGVVFIAAATDNLIRAIDLETGRTLWQAELPAGGQATPMTYEAGGRQYLVIMTGGHHFMETAVGDQVIAYALP